MSQEREHSIIDAFVSLANTITEGFDLVELLNDLTSRSAKSLDVASAGLLLADKHRTLHVVAASSERIEASSCFSSNERKVPVWSATTPVLK
jgi:hypothetical protein